MGLDLSKIEYEQGQKITASLTVTVSIAAVNPTLRDIDLPQANLTLSIGTIELTSLTFPATRIPKQETTPIQSSSNITLERLDSVTKVAFTNWLRDALQGSYFGYIGMTGYVYVPVRTLLIADEVQLEISSSEQVRVTISLHE